MMKFLKDEKAKKDDRKKKRKEEFEARLRDDEQDEMKDLMDEDVQMRRATQESIISQREWEDRQRFRQRTGGGQNVYEEGGGSNARGGISKYEATENYWCKETSFLKSIDAYDVSSRNTDYYFKLLDKVVEEVGEEYVVQVVTNNEGAQPARN
ncbi:WEB family protein [Senna tora]|uniref:WEB family protein n=1 Tax=Senna tora TaxID=362788 RepID=A0A834TA03_9FABA|nr:WEB family protein [Senna tora]